METTAPGKPALVPPLDELVDVRLLQQIQDWFAATTGLTTRIRDTSGNPITGISGLTEYCRLITGTSCGVAGCLQSHEFAVAALRDSDEPVRYDCHAHLLQIAAPIRVDGQLLGFIVVGQSPSRPLTRQEVEQTARRVGVDPEALWEAARKLPVWSEETARQTASVLMTVANAITDLSYQGYVLKRKLREFEALHQVTDALTESGSLAEVLAVIAQSITEGMGMRACLVRFINERTGTLDIAAAHGLSVTYRNKGPVALRDTLVGQAALRTGVVVVPDISQEARFRFREEAEAEGLRSMLCVGMESRGRPIGIVCVFTGELHEFTHDEVALLRTLADHAALAIERARLLDDLRTVNQRLRDSYEQTVSVQEQLVQAAQLAVLGQLASGIAHEAKNPLSAIMNLAGYVRDFAEELDAGEVRQRCQAIIDEVRRTTDIINEVREFARPATGFATETVSLRQLGEEVLELLRFDDDAQGVRLTADFPADGPYVNVNRDKFRQAVVNLVRNALQAVQPGAGEVRLGAREQDGAAVLVVSDNGHGIPRDQLARIWQPFFSTKGEAGMGLGLDIVRRIVTAHEGSVAVESREGEGTTFTITLPAVRPAPEPGA